jgi:hypothetical protein
LKVTLITVPPKYLMSLYVFEYANTDRLSHYKAYLSPLV